MKISSVFKFLIKTAIVFIALLWSFNTITLYIEGRDKRLMQAGYNAALDQLTSAAEKNDTVTIRSANKQTIFTVRRPQPPSTETKES